MCNFAARMETIILNDTTQLAQPACATIGFFDGVHRGHRFLVDQLRQLAAAHGERSMVITFARHPRLVVCPDWQPQLLTTLDEKLALLAESGVDVVVVLSFDRRMAALSAQSFMADVLRRQLGVATLLSGYDNRFGHNRSEGFDDYVAYGRAMDMRVVRAEALSMGDVAVSSSHIRRLISEGSVAQAADCLGRRYALSGCVEHGEQIGRTLGFPTANIALGDAQKLLPADGVYAVQVLTEGSDRLVGGVMNIGRRPTFDGHRRTLEVHLLDFSGDLYGRQLRVSFVERLRGERTFDSPDALIQQMTADARQAQQLINKN